MLKQVEAYSHVDVKEFKDKTARQKERETVKEL